MPHQGAGDADGEDQDQREIITGKRNIADMAIDQAPGKKQGCSGDQTGGGHVHAGAADLEHAVSPVHKGENSGNRFKKEAHMPDHHHQK